MNGFFTVMCFITVKKQVISSLCFITLKKAGHFVIWNSFHGLPHCVHNIEKRRSFRHKKQFIHGLQPCVSYSKKAGHFVISFFTDYITMFHNSKKAGQFVTRNSFFTDYITVFHNSKKEVVSSQGTVSSRTTSLCFITVKAGPFRHNSFLTD